jgi:hypothetical protein
LAEAIADRVRRYILDGSDEDLRRLLGVAAATQETARSAFRRVGMQEGWHAIECGCGPIGALAVMAEMVGPVGRVVGVDSRGHILSSMLLAPTGIWRTRCWNGLGACRTTLSMASRGLRVRRALTSLRSVEASRP